MIVWVDDHPPAVDSVTGVANNDVWLGSDVDVPPVAMAALLHALSAGAHGAVVVVAAAPPGSPSAAAAAPTPGAAVAVRAAAALAALVVVVALAAPLTGVETLCAPPYPSCTGSALVCRRPGGTERSAPAGSPRSE